MADTDIEAEADRYYTPSSGSPTPGHGKKKRRIRIEEMSEDGPAFSGSAEQSDRGEQEDAQKLEPNSNEEDSGDQAHGSTGPQRDHERTDTRDRVNRSRSRGKQEDRPNNRAKDNDSTVLGLISKPDYPDSIESRRRRRSNGEVGQSHAFHALRDDSPDRQMNNASTGSQTFLERIFKRRRFRSRGNSGIGDYGSNAASIERSRVENLLQQRDQILGVEPIDFADDLITRLRENYGDSVLDVLDEGVTVNFAALQQVVLECLQKEMLSSVLDFAYIRSSRVEESIRKVAPVLTSYVEAWKNLDYMTEVRKKKGYDPFIISSNLELQRKNIREAQSHWFQKNKAELNGGSAARRFVRDMENLHFRRYKAPADKKQTKLFGGNTRSARIKAEQTRMFFEKATMAVVGGAFLIVPMVIMIFVPGLNISVTTTSIFVLVFGLVMSWFLDAPFDVLSGTAAYAAVLVVFIGTGGGS